MPISKVEIKNCKMEINYIILVHKNHQQVLRLISRLHTPESNFYIHIDKGVNAIPFHDALSNKTNVFFIPDFLREYGTWGDIGIVKATTNALSQIVKDNRVGYCVLMSGQDYPLKNNEFINAFFNANYGINFIDTFEVPSNRWGIDGGLNRFNQYKFNMSTRRLDFVQLPSLFEKIFYKKLTISKLFKLLKSKQFAAFLKIFKKRKFPPPLKPFGGSQWWAFPIETVQEILKFIDSNPKYTNYHKNTLLPDETFFHSILIHLKGTNDTLVIHPSITYVNWTRNNIQLPVTFTAEDIEELREASLNKLFARKFNIEMDEKIVNSIDTVLRQ